MPQMAWHAIRQRSPPLVYELGNALLTHPDCCPAQSLHSRCAVTISDSCSAVIRRAAGLVPNQRYNININSNSNSNSYLLLLSRDSDVFWTLISSWEFCRPMFLAATFSGVNFCKTIFSALIFEWRHQNSGSYL